MHKLAPVLRVVGLARRRVQSLRSSGETDTQMHMVFHRYYGDGVWTCQSTYHLSGGGTVSVPFGPLAKEHISTAPYFVNEDGFTSKSINVR
ncbi:unnamed protein product [Boreogadus saida]